MLYPLHSILLGILRHHIILGTILILFNALEARILIIIRFATIATIICRQRLAIVILFILGRLLHNSRIPEVTCLRCFRCGTLEIPLAFGLKNSSICRFDLFWLGAY